MSECKLFVGNLSYDATEDDIRKVFDEFEPSDVIIITDRDTGRPRGFGFVTFSKESDMNAAKEKLNGHNLMGRELTVNSAAAKKQRSEGGGGYQSRGGGGYQSRDNSYGGGGGRNYGGNGGGGYGGGQQGGYGGGYQQGGRGGQGGYGGGSYGGGKIVI